MSFDPPINLPAGYVTGQAVAFTGANDHGVLVSATAPLPVAPIFAATSASALNGSTGVSASPGPYAPELGRPIWLTLAGSWTGSVQLQRSTDGGTTRLPLTALGQPYATYTANANEAAIEESCAGATYYLAVTLTAGTLSYRLAQ